MALSCCKKLYASLRGITSNDVGDFYFMNCFHSFSTKNKLKKHEMYPKIMSIAIWKSQKKEA